MARRTAGDAGRALMRWVDAELAAQGRHSWSGWARTNGVDPTKLSRWRDGVTDPDQASLEQVAAALGRPVHELLIAAGYLDATAVGAPPYVPTPPPDIHDAIRRDPSLSTADRDFLMTTLLHLRALSAATRPGTKGTKDIESKRAS